MINNELTKKTKENRKEENKNLNVKGKTLSLNKQQRKDQKNTNKSRNVRSLLNNYFMSRRRFYKIMESKMNK